MERDKAEQIALQLQKPDFDVAFVEANGVIYHSSYPRSLESPSSAVIKLLQGICDVSTDKSFLILRNRIFTTAAISERCRGMIKVAAKRATGNLQPQDHGLSLSETFREIGDSEEALVPSPHLSSENQLPLEEIQRNLEKPQASPLDFMTQVETLVSKITRGPVLYEHHWPIAALLIGPNEELLSYGLNSNALNKTLHAEVNLIQNLFRRTGTKIPRGSILFSTHKPCKMCAGMIHDWSEDPKSLRVFYRNEVEGVLSRQTILDRIEIQVRVESRAQNF